MTLNKYLEYQKDFNIDFVCKRDKNDYVVGEILTQDNLYSLYKNKQKEVTLYPRQLYTTLYLSKFNEDDELVVNYIKINGDINYGFKGIAYQIKIKDDEKEYYVLDVDFIHMTLTYSPYPYNPEFNYIEDDIEFLHGEGLNNFKQLCEDFKNTSTQISFKDLNKSDLEVYIEMREVLKHQDMTESEMLIDSIEF